MEDASIENLDAVPNAGGGTQNVLNFVKLDQAMASRREVSLSVLSERVKKRPSTGIPWAFWFFPGRHLPARWGSGNVRCFVQIYLKASSGKGVLDFLEHLGHLLRGLRDKNEVINKDEVGEGVRGDGEALVGVGPLLLEGSEKLLDSENKQDATFGGSLLATLSRGTSLSGVQPQMWGEILLPRSSRARLK